MNRWRKKKKTICSVSAQPWPEQIVTQHDADSLQRIQWWMAIIVYSDVALWLFCCCFHLLAPQSETATQPFWQWQPCCNEHNRCFSFQTRLPCHRSRTGDRPVSSESAGPNRFNWILSSIIYTCFHFCKTVGRLVEEKACLTLKLAGWIQKQGRNSLYVRCALWPRQKCF